jgi:protein-tyrosine phosphatase
MVLASAMLCGCTTYGQRCLPDPRTTGQVDAGGDGQEDAGAICRRGRSVLQCEATNARDLGGIPLASGGSVACGVLFRGGPLAGLSAAGCSALTDLGVQSVVDLRTPDERAARPDSVCPASTAKSVFAPLPVPYSVSPEDYIADLDASASIAAIFSVLGDASAYPVYFHCTWGRDRTGVVAAVILLTLGAARSDIMADYLLSQTSVGAYPDSLDATLTEIDRRGGVGAYLAAAGVTVEQIAVLRTRAIAP